MKATYNILWPVYILHRDSSPCIPWDALGLSDLIDETMLHTYILLNNT